MIVAFILILDGTFTVFTREQSKRLMSCLTTTLTDIRQILTVFILIRFLKKAFVFYK